MTANGLAALSDQVGPLIENTAEEKVLALRAALRVLGSRDEVAALAEALGLGSVLDEEFAPGGAA